jgi:hypothetical protein
LRGGAERGLAGAAAAEVITLPPAELRCQPVDPRAVASVNPVS